jgi:alpha-L-arabinofuranosidase
MVPIEKPIGTVGWSTLIAGFACLAASAEPREGNAAKPEGNHGGASQATVAIDLKAHPKPCDPMIYGGFLEHFDRQIYGGVFEPGSPLSDPQGFRKDVIEALKELKVPVIRWPGGCFVDSYHWRKGVGENRQPYDDDRWGVVEPNTFGTDEFVGLCRRLNAEPYICHNGLTDVREMADWVAYCNTTSGPFAEMRRENGHAEPFKTRGKWAIALVNRHPADASDCHVLVDGTPLDGTFMATLLAGDSPDAYNGIGRPDRVKPEKLMVSIQNGVLRLPPHSLMIVRNLTQRGEKR